MSFQYAVWLSVVASIHDVWSLTALLVILAYREWKSRPRR